jgi:DNA primase
MAGRIPPQFIDEVLARTDVVELINGRVPLRKAGKDYQACCPFHDEKTPSFTVSRDKQFYHCFGCGAHGSAIGFLMEYGRLGFLDAVEELARRAGLKLPTDGEWQQGPNYAPHYALLEEAAAFFRRQLREHPDAAGAVAYLKSRGLTGEVAARFGVGFAPPERDLMLLRFGDGASARERLIETGLVVGQDGKPHDRFRDRIMFPIRDRRGRVIGFGGRVLGDGKPKYLNSPETPLFRKGRELYGFYEAQQASRKIPRLLVVEGYMDVIALAQHDILYAVATLGTATTPDHLERLLTNVPAVTFCFDGDHAGRAAAWKALETCLPVVTGRQEIRFLFLPEGEDPDTLVRKEGRTAFEERVGTAKPFADFFVEHFKAQVDTETLDGMLRVRTLAEPFLAKVPSGRFRDMLAAYVTNLVPKASRDIAKPSVPAAQTTQRRRARAPCQIPLTPLRLAVALVLQYPALASVANAQPDNWRRLDNPGIPLLTELLDSLATRPDITAGALLERWRDTPDAPHLARLSDPGLLSHIPPEGVEPELIDAVGALNSEWRARERKALLNRLSPAQWSEDDKRRLREGLNHDPGEPTASPFQSRNEPEGRG